MLDYKDHRPVLKDEIIRAFCSENLSPPEGIYICDCTFGGGGHSFALLERLPGLKIIAFDQDIDAVDNGIIEISNRGLEDRIFLSHCNFSQLLKKIEKMELSGQIYGILFDLGVSSHHFGTPSRGFSLQHEGPLDMRMNQNNFNTPTAKEILEQKSEEEIAEIIYRYGEEKYSKRIAAEIVKFRSHSLFESTKQLENIVFHCYPKRERYKKTHPATRTFQALRLYINQELELLEQVLEDALQVLRKGGKIAAISFHSLEDRIVKHQFREFAQIARGEIITKKPILPTAKEWQENKRSRSAKLRIIKKG